MQGLLRGWLHVVTDTSHAVAETHLLHAHRHVCSKSLAGGVTCGWPSSWGAGGTRPCTPPTCPPAGVCGRYRCECLQYLCARGKMAALGIHTVHARTQHTQSTRADLIIGGHGGLAVVARSRLAAAARPTSYRHHTYASGGGYFWQQRCVAVVAVAARSRLPP